ncbi:MAG: hypothetical protein QGG38_02715 [Nitrospinaceae bacterium]|nr:hypothetical protein [Nitrospinaceae bacterium]
MLDWFERLLARQSRIAIGEEGTGWRISLIVCRKSHSWKFEKTDPSDKGLRGLNFLFNRQVRLYSLNIYPLIVTVPAIQSHHGIPVLVV